MKLEECIHRAIYYRGPGPPSEILGGGSVPLPPSPSSYSTVYVDNKLGRYLKTWAFSICVY